jgi:uncharacterized protein YaiL (DUF2058 family)
MGLGLADKKQVQKDKAEKRKQQKQARKHKTDVANESQVAAQKSREEKAERDRQLNKERQQQAEQKAILAQVKQIVERTRLELPEAEIKFNFADRNDKKVKFVYVTPKVQDDLAKGRLAIATADERYFIVAKSVAEKIMERSDNSIVYLAEPQDETIDDDDPYKDFVIPDDLMW